MRPYSAGRDRFIPETEAAAIIAALPIAIIVVDAENRIRDVNPAGEQLLQGAKTILYGVDLAELLVADSPVFGLIEATRESQSSVAEYGLIVEGPKLGHRIVSAQSSPIGEPGGNIVLAMQELSLTAKIDRQLTHRHAAKSVSAMAAMLAHEVKNPLSGIRGAAQLLEQTVEPVDRELTGLICAEVDRIRTLVDRMEVFTDARPIDREPVNIHEVLERVRKLAQNGFARHVRFVESYDPSLPPVLGNRDLLVQVFLNLVKNAAEAVPHEGGEIALATAYQHGIRLAVKGSKNRLQLPLVVSVRDNGGGIPEDLRMHLFDPFVTTKRNGTGLGLALVAKIVGDHGGVVDFDSQLRRTEFRVMLPMAGSEGAE
jgi:two-component system nitrogen regulation sensor histidine kinase GlnL